MFPLKTIVYVSTATQLLAEAQLEALLQDAMTHNKRLGVTGVLLYSGGDFMQCIEGPDQAVQTIYERITASHLHKNMIELLNEPCAACLFPSWHMGLACVTQSELLALSTTRWQQEDGVTPDTEGAAAIRRLLHRFWQRTRH